MALPQRFADPSISGPLGTLALSVVRPHTSSLALRAVGWHSDLERLGLQVPLNVVHDIGLLLACPNEQLALGPRADLETLRVGGATRKIFEAYRYLVDETAKSDVAQRSRRLGVSDDLIVVLLARLLTTAGERVAASPNYPPTAPLDASLFDRVDAHLADLFHAADRTFETQWFEELSRATLYILTLVDALDADTLELFGILGGEAVGGALAQVDLLSVLESPEANDVVSFSLQILPSVLETKPHRGMSTVASFGYSGLARRGSIDNLVLTELAWDEDELARRIADDEVLYFAREHSQEILGRRHVILLDASASMRGERSTFARGMALALAKQLLLAGDAVTLRFFDSRLYEAHSAKAGRLPIGHLLSFRGEHGRNPRRALGELVSVLEVETARDARETVVHLLTHGALYIPRKTVEAVRRLAKLTAVFMMPSGGELRVDYLDLLDAHWVIDHSTLASQKQRAERALGILEDVDHELAHRAEQGLR